MDIIFLVYDNIYYYNYEKSCFVPFKNNIITRIMLKIFTSSVALKFSIFCINKKFLKILDKVQCVILSDYATGSEKRNKILKYIFDKNNIVYAYYYMNCISNNNKFILKEKNVFTFDKAEAEKYNIGYMHTPYSSKVVLPNNKCIYDVLFLGRNKGRDDEIDYIYNRMKELNIKCKFMVLDSLNEEIKIDEFIEYEKYIELVSKSKCILEINLPNQAGCTLRFMESLFLKKKLITNNKDIINDTYYDKENMFILNDNYEELKEFINKSYVENDMDLSELDFQNWIGSFYEKINK